MLPNWLYMVLAHAHVATQWGMYIPALSQEHQLLTLACLYISIIVAPAAILRYMRAPRSSRQQHHTSLTHPLQSASGELSALPAGGTVTSGPVKASNVTSPTVSEDALSSQAVVHGGFQGFSVPTRIHRVAAAGPSSGRPVTTSNGGLPASLIAATRMVQSKPHRMYASPLGSQLKVCQMKEMACRQPSIILCKTTATASLYYTTPHAGLYEGVRPGYNA
jgi:hypothetical protein